jgi:hypothetical protein
VLAAVGVSGELEPFPEIDSQLNWICAVKLKAWKLAGSNKSGTRDSTRDFVLANWTAIENKAHSSMSFISESSNLCV